MRYFLVTYFCGENFGERRGAYHAEHLDLAHAAVARGELLFGGGLTGEPLLGKMLFQGETESGAEAFARRDPYVQNGLVTWEVREWFASAVSPAITGAA